MESSSNGSIMPLKPALRQLPLSNVSAMRAIAGSVPNPPICARPRRSAAPASEHQSSGKGAGEKSNPLNRIPPLWMMGRMTSSNWLEAFCNESRRDCLHSSRVRSCEKASFTASAHSTAIEMAGAEPTWWYAAGRKGVQGSTLARAAKRRLAKPSVEFCAVW
jgi:hypothetical protein